MRSARLWASSPRSWNRVNEQPRLPLLQLTRVIKDRYAPEARFGRFEVCAGNEDRCIRLHDFHDTNGLFE